MGDAAAEVGVVGERPVQRLRIGAEPGPVLEVLTLGATLHALHVADPDGSRRPLLVGLDDVPAYLASDKYVGGVIGRYANRIAGAQVDLDGRRLDLPAFDRGSYLHGSPAGWERRVWDVVAHEPDRLVLGLDSPDGDQGFPGALRAEVTYVVRAAALEVTFDAWLVDAAPATLVNLTTHAYWAPGGPVGDLLLEVPTGRYVPVDDLGIPLSADAPVAGTGFDLRAPVAVADAGPGLVDHTFLVAGEPDADGLRLAARLTSATSGWSIEVHTDQPGVQVYTGWPQGVALEPGLPPDTPHRPALGDARLAAGERYRWRTRVDLLSAR